jgi:hypothetical protein
MSCETFDLICCSLERARTHTRTRVAERTGALKVVVA